MSRVGTAKIKADSADGVLAKDTLYDAETLPDIHTRAHESLRHVIAFCDSLTHEGLRRPLHGFGFPAIHRQLERTIGAEVYWRAQLGRSYLGAASEAELNRAREMISDPGQAGCSGRSM